MVILVTGAAGFVGTHLLQRLRDEDADVIAWHRPAGDSPRVSAARQWAAIELLDRGAVEAGIRDVRPDVIYHLAGWAHVAQSWQHTRATYEGNVLATHHLL